MKLIPFLFLSRRLKKNLKEKLPEIIVVNDGSTDKFILEKKNSSQYKNNIS